MHLKSRNHTFHFRLTIPKDLRASLGCCEITRSLRTGNQAAAKAMASVLSFKLRDVFESARRNSASSNKFQDLVDDHVKACFSMLEELTIASPPAHRRKATAGPEHAWSQKYERPDACECVSAEAIQGFPNPPTPATPSVPLAELISRYNAEQEGSWSVSTRNNYLGIAKVMRQLIGAGTPVSAMDRAVFRDYRNALRRLPKRFAACPDFEGMTSHKVLAMDKPEITIEPKVVNKYISYASSLFKWARVMGYMEDNPAEGMRVMVEDKETAMFDDADLARIFGCPDYAVENPAQFWVPLLGLYTGARLNEICQLYVQDIVREVDDGGAFWWISINDEG